MTASLNQNCDREWGIRIVSSHNFSLFMRPVYIFACFRTIHYILHHIYYPAVILGYFWLSLLLRLTFRFIIIIILFTVSHGLFSFVCSGVILGEERFLLLSVKLLIPKQKQDKIM